MAACTAKDPSCCPYHGWLYRVNYTFPAPSYIPIPSVPSIEQQQLRQQQEWQQYYKKCGETYHTFRSLVRKFKSLRGKTNTAENQIEIEASFDSLLFNAGMEVDVSIEYFEERANRPFVKFPEEKKKGFDLSYYAQQLILFFAKILFKFIEGLFIAILTVNAASLINLLVNLGFPTTKVIPYAVRIAEAFIKRKNIKRINLDARYFLHLKGLDKIRMIVKLFTIYQKMTHDFSKAFQSNYIYAAISGMGIKGRQRLWENINSLSIELALLDSEEKYKTIQVVAESNLLNTLNPYLRDPDIKEIIVFIKTIFWDYDKPIPVLSMSLFAGLNKKLIMTACIPTSKVEIAYIKDINSREKLIKNKMVEALISGLNYV